MAAGKSLFSFFSIVLIPFLFTACDPVQQSEPVSASNDSLTRYVDPFIGTAEHGHVYPGATVPFGMVQLSPDNGTQGWDWCSGYNWIDSTIVGFSHTHLSGTGIGDLLDISMMPANARLDFSKQDPPKNSEYTTTFSHTNESAQPGYYSVLLDNGIRAELTASTRVGMHRYTFPDAAQKHLLLDLGFAINWDKPTRTSMTVDGENRMVTGYRYSTGWAKDQRVYFAAKFSEPISGFTLADSTEIIEETRAEGEKLRFQLQFGNATRTVLVKVGLSTADDAGAIAALDEIPDWDFDAQKENARMLWEEELSKIRISTTDENLRKVFYTSLYRTCLAPVVMSDANGKYKGADGKVHTSEGWTRYDIFSLWDTFRAANPLYTIIQEDRINDFIQSMLAHYDEYGLLPVWSLLGNETNTMTGYHAIPVLVDAYMKGFRDYDVEKAYQAVIASAMQDIRGTDDYREYGYIPFDKEGESVTRTLEYAYDDWCIAQFAKALGKEEDYRKFMERSESYRPLFDPKTGFMRAKYSNGKWKTPFDPQYSSHDFSVAEYTEGNAWQHSWFVPQDPASLIALHGGDEPFVTKLDSLFTIDSEIRGDFASADISGLIGQYAHGNEPSHHIAYLYNYAGVPSKTQDIVRKIIDTQYNDTPSGLCGNEDCGQMSAWYVFSAMGFYPVNPAQGVYVIGTPVFNRVEIENKTGKDFIVIAEGTSSENRFIQSASWNGAPYSKTYITHDMITTGGTLEFEMGKTPNNTWGTSKEAFPPSNTM